jgi:lipopolysaccharide transport system ATP-binding protein
MSDTVISVEHLSKRYRLGVINTGTFKDDLKVWFAQTRGKPNPLSKVGEADYGNRDGNILWALKDINFTVQRGEALGIIGRNGAGKSTLLKILSRVTTPTEGHVHVKGRIASLLEVGTGFHPELTGRENIYLNGAIMGMDRAEVTRKFDEIVDFSGVEKFIDTPVKRYSSGMYVRLAFAVAAHLEPDILIVDEVLAVGDAEFQKKCLGKMGDVAHEGRTVIFVSHNMASIRMLCKKGIWINHGSLAFEGDTDITISTYLDSLMTNAASYDIQERKDRRGNGKTKLVNIEIINQGKVATQSLFSGEPITFVFRLSEDFEETELTFGIYDKLGIDIAGFTTTVKAEFDYHNSAGESSFACFIPELLLPPGIYFTNVYIVKNGLVADHVDAAITFEVHEGYVRGRPVSPGGRAKALIPHQWIRL